MITNQQINLLLLPARKLTGVLLSAELLLDEVRRCRASILPFHQRHLPDLYREYRLDADAVISAMADASIDR